MSEPLASHSTSRPTDIPAALLPLLSTLTALLHTLSQLFHRVPGSPIIARYIKSSYQDDPYRSLLEVLLLAFAVRTLLKGRTRGEGEGKNFIKFSEKVSRVIMENWLANGATSMARNNEDVRCGQRLHMEGCCILDDNSRIRHSYAFRVIKSSKSGDIYELRDIANYPLTAGNR